MSRMRRLTVVLGLNLALVAGLVAVGITARSLAVFAEGGDYLLDAAAVAVTMFAVWLSSRPPRPRRPEGRPNATSTAALINAGWLLTLEFLVAAGAADRLLTRTPHVSGLPVLIVSAIAAVVMTIGAIVLSADEDADEEGDDDGDLSVAAVLLDTIADAAAAAGVAITGAIILAAGGLFWLDPAVALAIAAVISWHALALIRKIFSRRRLPTTPSGTPPLEEEGPTLAR